MTNDIPQSLRSEFPPTGKLRVALNQSNFLLVTPNRKADPRGAWRRRFTVDNIAANGTKSARFRWSGWRKEEL